MPAGRSRPVQIGDLPRHLGILLAMRGGQYMLQLVYRNSLGCRSRYRQSREQE
jgi:hypothetical protein